jgi:hypothetical protein
MRVWIEQVSELPGLPRRREWWMIGITGVNKW